MGGFAINQTAITIRLPSVGAWQADRSLVVSTQLDQLPESYS